MLLPTYPFLIKNSPLHYKLNNIIQSKLIHYLFKRSFKTIMIGNIFFLKIQLF
jgi:hypothetical protein